MAKYEYELAGTGQRFLALFIDGILLGIVTGILVGAGREAGGVVSFLIGAAYQWFFLTRMKGQTPGKMLMGIRVIKTDGSAISDIEAVLRYVGYYINSAIFMLGWLLAFIDSNNQGLHDKISNTYVVRK